MWGLYCIIRSLDFLHSECNIVHGNLSLESIYVNKGYVWKLGGFDLAFAKENIPNEYMYIKILTY